MLPELSTVTPWGLLSETLVAAPLKLQAVLLPPPAT
jgi:hypothetical protein